VEIARITTKKLNMNSPSLDWHSKPGLPDYKGQEAMRVLVWVKYIMKIYQQMMQMGDCALCVGINMEGDESGMERYYLL
jgi:hypothetical protein